MSSGLRLALLTLNLTQNDFVRMNRDNLKEYIEDFFKQEYVQKDFEKYKIAAKLALENKSRIEDENIYDDDVNVEEENRLVRRISDENQYNRHNLISNPYYHNPYYQNPYYHNPFSYNPFFNNPFSIFNNNFSTMINEIDNLHNYVGSNMVNTNSSNMVNTSNNTNGFTSSYSKTYINNNGNGYIKEESIENNGNGTPKVKSFYKKIENGKYI